MKLGRNAGPSHPPPSTWNQNGPDEALQAGGFGGLQRGRLRDGQLLAGHGRLPARLRGADQAYVDANGVYTTSYLDEVHHQRPQTQFNVTPSFFLRTGNVGHEIKAGFHYRHTPYDIHVLPGRKASWASTASGPEPRYNVAGFTRPQLEPDGHEVRTTASSPTR